MVDGKKVIVILPAYNASKTLKQTYEEIPFDIVDEVVLTDDASKDETIEIARQLEIRHILIHERNKGYGANQKTCYRKALDLKADIIIMLHPDYQYEPRLMRSMVYLISQGVYSTVLGSRILGSGALRGGMPLYKYIGNRILTFLQNLATGAKLSEYHTGYRAYDANVLRKIDFEVNNDDFIFDNELLSQIILARHTIAEITCPTRYFAEASSINFKRSIIYGLGVLRVSVQHVVKRWGVYSHPRYRAINAAVSIT
jgi:glycosyltransferase involved in cell wall biosynthesis